MSRQRYDRHRTPPGHHPTPRTELTGNGARLSRLRLSWRCVGTPRPYNAAVHALILGGHVFGARLEHTAVARSLVPWTRRVHQHPGEPAASRTPRRREAATAQRRGPRFLKSSRLLSSSSNSRSSASLSLRSLHAGPHASVQGGAARRAVPAPRATVLPAPRRRHAQAQLRAPLHRDSMPLRCALVDSARWGRAPGVDPARLLGGQVRLR